MTNFQKSLGFILDNYSKYCRLAECPYTIETQYLVYIRREPGRENSIGNDVYEYGSYSNAYLIKHLNEYKNKNEV